MTAHQRLPAGSRCALFFSGISMPLLALGLFLVDVDENDFGRHTVHGQGIRDGGAHITGAQNGDFFPFSHTVVSLNSIGLPGSGWLHKPRGTPSPAPR